MHDVQFQLVEPIYECCQPCVPPFAVREWYARHINRYCESPSEVASTTRVKIDSMVVELTLKICFTSPHLDLPHHVWEINGAYNGELIPLFIQFPTDPLSAKRIENEETT